MDYFTDLARTSYAVPPVEGGFEYLLNRGAVFVIFDGLDEVMDHADRAHVRDIIESFCRRFPLAPVLITSRVVGYGHAAFDAATFDVVRIEDFDSDQVAAYAQKWYVRERSLSPVEQQDKTDAFLIEAPVSAISGAARSCWHSCVPSTVVGASFLTTCRTYMAAAQSCSLIPGIGREACRRYFPLRDTYVRR